MFARSRHCLCLCLFLPACITLDVDLRTPAGGDDAAPLVCASGTRLDATGERCLPCINRTPPPAEACACQYTYQPAPLPYCDTPTAHYECEPCTGDITSCAAYDAASQTTASCRLVAACCAELEASSTPCCDVADELACALIPGSDGPRYKVGCLPKPCCVPACTPDVEQCRAIVVGDALACECSPVGDPP